MNDAYGICSEDDHKKLFALLRESHMALLNYKIGQLTVSDEQMAMKVEIEYYDESEENI